LPTLFVCLFLCFHMFTLRHFVKVWFFC
jgi:hypothetical protein